MIEGIVFWGLCAVLVFVPLPIGSVEEWSVFAFEAATIFLTLLYVAGRLAGRKAPARPEPGLRASDRLEGRLPGFVKVLLGVFLGFSVLQIAPLPASLVKVLSPRAYAIHAGLVRDAISAPSPSLTLSLNPAASLYELVLIVCYGLFGYLVLRTVRGRGRAEILVVVILASALFQAFYGMAETFSGHEMILGRPKRYGLGSVTGTFVNRNHFAGFLEMAFPLGLGYLLVKARYFAMEKGLSLRRRILWFSQESLQWTLLLGLAPVFIGVGLIFSKSRSGIMILAVTAVLAAAAVASWRELSDADGEGEGRGEASGAWEDREAANESRRRFGRIVRFVLAFVLAAAVWIGIGPVIKRFSEVDISAEARRTFYRDTVELIGDYLWTGSGKGTYVNAYAMYEKVDDRLRLSYAHNDYLETAAENGLVGGGALAAAGIGLLVALAGMWRRRRNPFDKGIGLGAMLGVAALLIHAFTDFNLQITANAVYFTTLAALGLAVMFREPRAVGNGGAGKRPGAGDRLRPFLAAALAAAVFVPAVRSFLGYRELALYRRERAAARSVESAFPALEARLARAASLSPLAVFQAESARLDMEMARVANDAGRDEDRDTFCDRAVARYGRAIAANPIDAGLHYEMGTAYLLYNFPLMTYQDRARAYFRQALRFKPADETINLNVQFLFFTWWPTLEEGERQYAAGLYRSMTVRSPDFPAKLERRWTRSYGAPDALRAILADLPAAR
ncbi:MAG TPA: O-antigen ligase family protein [Candidatus Aminicenantes bacterium]|nr:O-antigen ligase family protein [Candidatus Aminicenantes bacterium]HRY65726.1 O-antigen ligase family protein [Candidatus Aminicenantes bacterium]HRZ72640.1 O-antigen ligase family protein [Candidatus Aminicenantes bacterium]